MVRVELDGTQEWLFRLASLLEAGDRTLNAMDFGIVLDEFQRAFGNPDTSASSSHQSMPSTQPSPRWSKPATRGRGRTAGPSRSPARTTPPPARRPRVSLRRGDGIKTRSRQSYASRSAGRFRRVTAASRASTRSTMVATMRAVISSCRPNSSCNGVSKRSAHACSPLPASMSCAVMRTRSPSCARCLRDSSGRHLRPTRRGSTSRPRYTKLALRDTTKSPLKRARSMIRSSDMPSTK